MENLVVFATLVLVTFGLTGVRTVAFLVGFGAQVAVALSIFC